MFGRNKIRMVQCELRSSTSADVIRRSFDNAQEIVLGYGLPVEGSRQMNTLGLAMIDLAMDESGLGKDFCANCFEKDPTCLREVTTEPQHIDYSRLADTALEGFQKQLEGQRSWLFNEQSNGQVQNG